MQPTLATIQESGKTAGGRLPSNHLTGRFLVYLGMPLCGALYYCTEPPNDDDRMGIRRDSFAPSKWRRSPDRMGHREKCSLSLLHRCFPPVVGFYCVLWLLIPSASVLTASSQGHNVPHIHSARLGRSRRLYEIRQVQSVDEYLKIPAVLEFNFESLFGLHVSNGT